jgi:hypothetical protein
MKSKVGTVVQANKQRRRVDYGALEEFMPVPINVKRAEILANVPDPRGLGLSPVNAAGGKQRSGTRAQCTLKLQCKINKGTQEGTMNGLLACYPCAHTNS